MKVVKNYIRHDNASEEGNILIEMTMSEKTKHLKEMYHFVQKTNKNKYNKGGKFEFTITGKL